MNRHLTSLARQKLDMRLCHAPDPGPTRLANSNRFRGAKEYAGTPYFLFFFLKAELITVVYK